MRYPRILLMGLGALAAIVAAGVLLAPWPAAAADSDGDGYDDAREAYLGTNPFAVCGANAWPPDVTGDGSVNISDFFAFLPPNFGWRQGDPAFSQRRDLNADGINGNLDIAQLTPPMFATLCGPPPYVAPPATGGIAVAIDMNVAGNDARLTAGVNVQDCGQIDSGGGNTVQIDVIVPEPGAPAADGIKAWEFMLNYDPGVVSVTSEDRSLLLAQAAGSGLTGASDTLPDAGGSWRSGGFDNASPGSPEPAGPHEVGRGVLTRITLTGVAQGTTPLWLTKVGAVTAGNAETPVTSVSSATVSVDEPCVPVPAPTPTPTPTPGPTPTPTPTPTPPADPQLAGYWRLNEGSGTSAADSSGNGNHGVLEGGPVWVSGVSGTALQLDGVNDYVRINDSASLDIAGPFTLIAWVNPDSAVGCYESFVNKYLNYALQTCATNRLRMISGGVGEIESPDFTLVPGVWQHVAGTWDGGNMRLYHDGELVASANLGSHTPVVSDNPLTIGMEILFGGWEFFGGKVDEVKVYNGALSPAQIAADFAMPTPTPTQLAIFSVRAPDIVGPPAAVPCEAAALLTLPTLTGSPCTRPPLAPDRLAATASLGLDLGGAFSDNLDALSLGELNNLPSPAFHFSVDSASAGVACAAPDVASEAGLGEAPGDIFTDLNVSGCNQRFQDEATHGLNAPGLPLDDVDALTDPPVVSGPCDLGSLSAVPCPAFSVDSASAVDGTPDPLNVSIRPAALLVPPGTPATGVMTGACPSGGRPCVAVRASDLRLDSAGAGSDDLDALCWFDRNGNGLPELPLAAGGPDQYYFSLTPGSATLAAAAVGPADILAPSPYGVILAVSETRLGLAPSDNLDGLKCLDPDSDGDGNRDAEDACPFTYTPPWFAPPGDEDCDGWTTADENLIGTHAASSCANTQDSGDEDDDKWPPDFDDNQVVNISDVFYLLPPTFGTAVPPISARRDLAPDGVINISDVFKVLPPYFGASCT